MPGQKAEEAAVSRDSRISMLLSQLSDGADAAIAASAFRTLMTTLPNSSDDDANWELPVTVQSVQAADGPRSTFVSIDKPLVPRAATLRRKHEVLFKAALVSLCTRASRQTPDSPATKGSGGDRQVRPPGGDATCAARSDQNGERGDGGKDSSKAYTDAGHMAETPAPHVPVQQGGEQPIRGVRYDLWRVGKFRVIVRSHEVARTIASSQRSTHREPSMSTAQQDEAPVICRAKVEYHARDGMEQVRS